jgi:hypothetical protein
VCVPSPVPPPGVFIHCVGDGPLSLEAQVALVSALGDTTGPAREEAREALMAGALVDDPTVHRAMRQAGALTAAEARGLPTLRQALRALRRAVGRERAAIGVCRLELSGARRGGALELTSQTRYCADGAVVVVDFLYDPDTRLIRVLRAEIEHLR